MCSPAGKAADRLPDSKVTGRTTLLLFRQKADTSSDGSMSGFAMNTKSGTSDMQNLSA